MKYKVGDKVRIKSIDWYNKNKDSNGNIVFSSKVPHFSWCVNVRTMFTKDMVNFCGKVVTIESVWTVNYSIVEGTYRCYFTDEMIEGLAKEETKPKFKVGDKVILDPYPCVVTDVHWRDSLHGFVYTVRGTDFSKIVKENELVFDERPTPTTDEIMKNIKADWNNFKNRYNLPNEYHFVDKNGNEINISEIVLEKKKRDVSLTQEQINTMVHDSCVLFCKHCGCGIPRETCTSLGTCKEHDEYRDAIRTHLLEKKKKEYPKTYEECLSVLEIYNGLPDVEIYNAKPSECKLFESFIRLKRCRDAYWKLYGEETGLGKPWEPDWKNEEDWIHCITTDCGEIYCTGFKGGNKILAFPTEEMRDAFYENFKEEIEKCKELL